MTSPCPAIFAMCLLGGLFTGCTRWVDTPPDADGDVDGDTDTDSDTDRDGDSDTDRDGDTDGETDQDLDSDSDATALPTSPRCDPDGRAPCCDESFTCVETDDGSLVCEVQGPATPGEGNWSCREVVTMVVCEGSGDYSDDWFCDSLGSGTTVCRRRTCYPGIDGVVVWDCSFFGETRRCVERAELSLCPPSVEPSPEELCGDGVDNDCNTWIDEGCVAPCLCIPGATRFCDALVWGVWGTQRCAENGDRWEPCREVTDIPAVCVGVDSWYSPAAESCCIEAGFCCVDLWDLNLDGDAYESLGDCNDIICG